ncbi:MAG: hypothetical protein N3B15_00380 [Planctomycetota bacterium]|nr:hypothetical protein [Planctomycetota bacterium]
MTMQHLRGDILLAFLWLALAALLAAAIAATGSEQRALARRLGADRDRLRDLEAKLATLRSELDALASPPALETALRRLRLPLQAPEMARR